MELPTIRGQDHATGLGLLVNPRPTVQELRRWYVEAQLSSYEIAELAGVSHTTVWKWLKAAGIPRRPRLWTANRTLQRRKAAGIPRRSSPGAAAGGRRRGRAVDPGRLQQLYVVEGQSIAQVARTFGVARATIHRHLARAGIQRRGPAGSKSPGRATLWALYVEQRLPMTEIGPRYGVTDRAVAKWLAAAGISVSRAEARAP